MTYSVEFYSEQNKTFLNFQISNPDMRRRVLTKCFSNSDEIIVSAMRIAFTFTVKFSHKRNALVNLTPSVDGSTALCLEN
ncbi:hypothetical protein T03_4136 [Trichinella britovi]|uniref:Uncharacterized protein n=1 Tax=Trichinella britovi TaxID=45882 RepID=A0A0V1CI96_TRIBR|nr:hypothetical protein T03_4136 [Trichinella britovi]